MPSKPAIATKADIERLRKDLIIEIEGSDKRNDMRFDKLEGRFGHLEGRFDKFEGRFDKLESSVKEWRQEAMMMMLKISDQLDRFMDNIQQEIARLKRKVFG